MLDWSDLESYSFGDSPAQADELAGLVLAGIKTATCWDASDGLSDKIGERMVILDGSGVAVAVVETVELFQRRFNEVDEAFAYDEGEGDRKSRILETGASAVLRRPRPVFGRYAA